jgi:hypothetical protein
MRDAGLEGVRQVHELLGLDDGQGVGQRGLHGAAAGKSTRLVGLLRFAHHGGCDSHLVHSRPVNGLN